MRVRKGRFWVKPELILVCPLLPGTMQTLDNEYVVHRLWEAEDKATMLAGVADRVRAVATAVSPRAQVQRGPAGAGEIGESPGATGE